MNRKLLDTLKKFNQTQLLRFESGLTPAELNALEKELDDINFDNLNKLINEYVLKKPEVKIPSDLKPAPYFPLRPDGEKNIEKYRQAGLLGEKLIRQGKCACITVAGGQGTRLGFDAPKGTYPIGPVSGKSLFGYFAESILNLEAKFSTEISWYIMTSLLNRDATEKFFKANKFFGLKPAQVIFFTQGTMPAMDYQGKILMNSKNSLALSPDGHGGTLLALKKSGCLADMKRKGIEYLSYFQVDNPLVKVIDPLFLGLHVMEKSEMSAIMLAKTNAFEKLGNFCMSNGKLEIIEYSDLPEELAKSTNPDGSLRFIAGSPAIHVISCNFIEKLTAAGTLKLPCHRADKKVAFIDDDGNLIKPDVPNAVKLETFIFDALPLAARTMVLEAERKTTFAPTKNQTGVDSVESCRKLIMERDAARLARAGVKVPYDDNGNLLAEIEISPLAIGDDLEAAEYVKKYGISEIKAGSRIYFK